MVLETRKQRKERCIKQVKKKNIGKPKSKKVNPFAVCEKSIPKFKGKRRRKLRNPGRKTRRRKTRTRRAGRSKKRSGRR